MTWSFTTSNRSAISLECGYTLGVIRMQALIQLIEGKLLNLSVSFAE